MPRYVRVTLKTPKADQTSNCSSFDPINFSDIGVEIRTIKYPLEAYDLDFSTGKVARANREESKFSTKFYGVEEIVVAPSDFLLSVSFSKP